MDLPDAPAVRTAVLDLLVRAAGRPCAHGAQAFGALVPPPARFAVALRVLLPVADGSAGADVCALSMMGITRGELMRARMRRVSSRCSCCARCMRRTRSR
jgi:hypothetical protein